MMITETMPEWRLHAGRLHLAFGDTLLCGGAICKPNDLPCEMCLEMLLELLDIAFDPAPEPAKVQPWLVG